MQPAGAMKTEPWSEEEDKIVEEHAGLGASPPHPFTMVGQLDNGCSGFLVGE